MTKRESNSSADQSILCISAARVVHSVSARTYSSRPSSTGMSAPHTKNEENWETGFSRREGRMSASFCASSNMIDSSASSIGVVFLPRRGRPFCGLVSREWWDVGCPSAWRTTPRYPSGTSTRSPCTVRPRKADTTRLGAEDDSHAAAMFVVLRGPAREDSPAVDVEVVAPPLSGAPTFPFAASTMKYVDTGAGPVWLM